MRRLTLDLTLQQVARVAGALDGAPHATGFFRLHGGSTDVYRIDIADRADPIVLKIYRDDPAWAPGKEALVASWIGDHNLGLPHAALAPAGRDPHPASPSALRPHHLPPGPDRAQPRRRA